MGLFSLTIQKDSGWEVMNDLGRLSCLHFIDLNRHEQIFNRTFAPLIKRVDEAERRIAYIETEMQRFGMKLTKPKSIQSFFKDLDDAAKLEKKDSSAYFEEIEGKVEETETYLQEQTKKYAEMHEHQNWLFQYKFVLSKAVEIMDQKRDVSVFTISAGEESQERAGLSYIAGTIAREDGERFRKMIFRRTRGNTLCIIKDLTNPIQDYYGTNIYKSMYVLVYKEGNIIRNMLNKVCDSFSNEKYEIPFGDMMGKHEEIEAKFQETKSLKSVTRKEIIRKLSKLAKGSMYEEEASVIIKYKWFMHKEKALYNALNNLKLENMLYKGICWIPLSLESEVQEKIVEMQQDRNLVPPKLQRIKKHPLTPPTYFRTNEFIQPFADIVETYGIPSYQEVNPTLFSIVTFPFLFGVMFGDVCHGTILFCVAAYICWRKDSILKSQGLLAGMVEARYLLLFMGIFACFCGFIYNDFASIPLTIVPSCWENTENGTVALKYQHCVYPFGIDPKWGASKNLLMFINSFKMKLAVILGVTQMGMGVILKGFNGFHFRKLYDVIFEWIPQMLFLWGFFGFMILMIFIKWATDWSDIEQRGPSLITQLINIPLKGGEPAGVPLWGNGDSQTVVNIIILITIMICVPWMLVIKPLMLKRDFNKEDSQRKKATVIGLQRLHSPDDQRHINPDFGPINDAASDGSNEDEINDRPSSDEGNMSILVPKEVEFDFGEIFIHQVIETIEFVLGTISNTASYLRLWALSLAHAQLSEVFFDFTMRDFLAQDQPSFFALFIGYIMLGGVTFGVLMCMDVLECFLHALRLHWVEFQNKFYKAEGYRFNSFSYEKILTPLDKERYN